MDKFIDARFERLEKALATLIDSVSKYNPSTAQAKELDAADAELARGLEEVQAHQAQYARVQELRQTTIALDTQIKETLSTLASTRKDLVATKKAAAQDGANNPVAYDELLSYARRISKTTLPPASVIDGLVSESFSSDINGTQTQPAASQTPAPTTQPSQTPLPTQSPQPTIKGSQVPSEYATQQTAATANTSLPEGLSMHLNPLTGAAFFPWPEEYKIRGGALAANQMLSQQGIDPRGYDPVVEEERRKREEEERQEREERERQERGERERKMREERERLRREREKQREEDREHWRRASVATGAGEVAPMSSTAGPGDKKQFQFTSIEDLDDDE